MSKLVTGQFLAQTTIQLFLTGIVVFFVQKYYEDVLTAKRIKQEIFIAAKRDAYSKAIEVAYRQMAITDYDKNALTGNPLPLMKRNKGTIPPNELEINTAFSTLYLYAGDTTVINSFYNIMVNSGSNYTPIYEMKKFLDAITKDLGNPDKTNKNYSLPYIVADTSHKKLEIH